MKSPLATTYVDAVGPSFVAPTAQDGATVADEPTSPSPAPVAAPAEATTATATPSTPEPAAPKTTRTPKGKAATADKPKGETVELTAAQAEGIALKDKVSSEIDDLWAKVEGRAPKPAADPEPADAEPTATTEAKPADTPADATPPPAADEIAEKVRAEERARIAHEADQKAADEKRIRESQQFQERVNRYVGADADMGAVLSALEAANLGDQSLLDNLDVLLPNGKRVSEQRGQKGLTPDEAQSLVNSWRQARELGEHVGDRKVQHILSLWDREVGAALDHPDVDAKAVTQHATPGEQMRALRESVTERVTKRVEEPLKARIAELEADVAKKATRIESLVAERGNLRSESLSQDAAEISRQGQGAAIPRGLPSPDDLHKMSADDAFKKGGAIDQLWSVIEGGTPRRRRTG